LFARLKQYIYALMAALALWAVLLAILPAVAKAQGAAPTNDTHQGTDRYADSAGRIVVRPGDSLWSISTERLGPSATPQQIANTVERIYALNRNRISDPDLILAGQKLLLPPVGKPTETGPTGPTARGETRNAPGPVVEPVAEPATLPVLPEEVAAASIPARSPTATSLTLNDSPRSVPESFLRNAVSVVSSRASALAEPFTEGRHAARRLLGLGLLVLSWGAAIGVGFIVARRRYVRAHTRRQDHWYREAYGKNYASLEAPEDFWDTPSPAPGALEPEQDSAPGFDDSGSEAAVVKNGPHQVRTIAWAQRRRNRILRRMRIPRRGRRSPRQRRTATGAHSPKIRHRLGHPYGLRPRGFPQGMMRAPKKRGGGG
jgi:LysM repeat protein